MILFRIGVRSFWSIMLTTKFLRMLEVGFSCEFILLKAHTR